MRLLVAALIAVATPASAQIQMTEGEVRSIDRDARKLTIKHGEIRNLDMPPMTMVFRVKEASMLDDLKSGDKVRISVKKDGNAFVVTRLEPVR